MMRISSKIMSALAFALMVSCSGVIDPDGTGAGDGNGSDQQKPGAVVSSGYRQQMVALQFTSVGCVNCPVLSTAIKNIQTNMPGTIIPMAFHLDYQISDPMTIASLNKKFYEMVDFTGETSIGLPMFALNFRKGSRHISSEYARIQSEIEDQAVKYPALCAVAVSTSYDNASNVIAVTARFKSDVAAAYRYHIFLLEDGIEYMQYGDETGTYVHNNVVRSMYGDNIKGSNLNSGKTLEVGKEYVVEKNLTVVQNWKPENLRVVVAMLKKDDGGDWASYNANVCALGESVDYLYDEKDE